ncbi:hypothetical protein [Bradyrhizobium sp. CCBAU 53421]|uniref:hypothetical protein n=1 Tax=Bradyrhizobium sp. CCBAU 53421 TaxID=1325120 RepID=UPI00188AB74E|nr:hypothetical protein [Bradyrhizobium sp. CCBAU 53421]QOZ32099.1 hypothetical protein XH92_10685 [Bradyrhizobium sp. CCBAU 53421]
MRSRKALTVIVLLVAAAAAAAVIGPRVAPKLRYYVGILKAMPGEQLRQSAVLANLQAEHAKQSSELAAIQAAQSEQTAEIRDEILDLQDRLSDLKTDTAGAASANSVQGSAAQLGEWAFLNDIDVYQKAGLLEVYGGTLTQKRTGPIGVTSAVLTTNARKSWLAWSPDYTPAINARQIELELDGDTIRAGTLTVGLILDDYSFTGWSLRLGPDMPVDPALKPADVPSDLAEAVAKAGTLKQLRGAGSRRYVATLPRSLKAALAGGSGRSVKSWVVILDGAGPGELAIRRLALTASDAAASGAAASTISGKVVGGSATAGKRIELVLEDNQTRSTELGLDGSFAFSDVPTRLAASLRYRFEDQDYYASLGRWFRPLAGAMVVDVPVRPEFDNPGRKEPNAAETDIKSEFDTDDQKNLTVFRYAKHRRTVWPGGPGYPREFAGRAFANNFGHLDRDRAIDNRDRCLRIGAVGGSTFVALQVKATEKFNVVLESELGRRLGRCVEVISAGRDNGDLAANYRAIRDYIMKFSPDVVLIEQMSGLATQMDARILKSTLGWSYEHNVLDDFYFDAKGALTFRPWDPSWALDAVAPTNEPLIKGLGIFDSFSIPYADFAPEAKASFDLFAAVARKLKSDYPNTRFVLASGHDQAVCHGSNSCDGKFAMPDGRTVRVGTAQLLENFARLCEQASIDCVQPPVPPAEQRLTYQHDAHYSVRGHQWLARHFADQLAAMLSRPALGSGK